MRVWILFVLLVFLAIGGFYGGLKMLFDPSGASMGLPISLLSDVPLDSFLLPGLFLTFVMGLLPLVASLHLMQRKPCD